MYILGIDSGAGRVSVAVNKDYQLLSRVEYEKNQRCMVSIIYLVDKALKKADISLDFVDLFAVNIGPGDFTGTRIGISVAKTFAWVKRKPIYGVGSLDVTALELFSKNLKKIQKLLEKGKQIIIAPVLDVKRGEIYFSFYKMDEGSLDLTSGSHKNHNSKDDHSEFKSYPVAPIIIQNKNYFIKKVSNNYLSGSKDFIKKFSTSFIYDDDFSSYILLGGSGFNSYRHLESEVNKLNDELNLKSSGMSFFGSQLKLLKGMNKNYGTGIFLDKRLFFPDAFHLNLCAYYGYLKNRQKSLERIAGAGRDNQITSDYEPDDYGLAPIYVREFTPFKT